MLVITLRNHIKKLFWLACMSETWTMPAISVYLFCSILLIILIMNENFYIGNSIQVSCLCELKQQDYTTFVLHTSYKLSHINIWKKKSCFTARRVRINKIYRQCVSKVNCLMIRTFFQLKLFDNGKIKDTKKHKWISLTKI